MNDPAVTPTTQSLSPGGSRPSWRWGLVGILLSLAYAPMLWRHFLELWEHPEYQYFPFVLAAFVAMLVVRFRESKPVESNGVGWRFYLFSSAAVVLFILANIILSSWLTMVSAILAMGAVLAVFAKGRRVPGLWGIWILLWLLLPLPLGWDKTVTWYLQQNSSQLSSTVLDLVGIDHGMLGNVLALPEKQFFVDEACSGIVSLMSVIAVAAIYSVWRRRSAVHFVALVAAGVGWATVVNVFRICVIAFVYDRWDLDWSSGTSHEILGLSIFLVTFVALIATDVFLSFALAPVTSPSGQKHDSRLVSLWNRMVHWGVSTDNRVEGSAENVTAWTWPAVPVPLLVVSLLLVSTSLLAFASEKMSDDVDRNVAMDENWIDACHTIDGSLWYEALDGWSLTEFTAEKRERDSIFGRYSRLSRLSHPDQNTLILSVDYPIWADHELTVCYRSIGWQLVSRDVDRDMSASDGEQWRLVKAEFVDPTGARGLLYFSFLDGAGEPTNPRATAIRDVTLFDRIFHHDRRTTSTISVDGVAQVQAWSAWRDGAKPADEAEVKRVFLQFRERVRDHLKKENAERIESGSG